MTNIKDFRLQTVCTFLLILLTIVPSCKTANTASEQTGITEVSENFLNPPIESRPGAFWPWLNGNTSRERISRDLREMSEKGMGRAEIWDVAAVNNPDNYIPAGPSFLSDSSVAMIKYTLEEAKKYGIHIGMVGSSGWNAGGTWVKPEWASKQLYFSSISLRGPAKETVQLPFPEVSPRCPKDENGMPVYYKEVAVLAFPNNGDKEIENTEKIINLTSYFKDGELNVDLPSGDWVVMRFILSNNGQTLIVPSPNSGGLFIDFLDPQSTIKHLSQFINRLGITRDNNKDGGLGYLEFDSMELADGIIWTDRMAEVFKERRGYDIIAYLPLLAGWTMPGNTERFMYDWKKTVSDQLIHSHYETGRKFLAEYDIDLVAEGGGPGPPVWATCPVDAIKALGNVTIPRGEFWVKHRDIYLVKEIASAANIYDRDIVDAESFTTWRRWKDSPFDLKKIVDRAFCEGLNCVTFHTFASTAPEDGFPGRTYHAGSDINHANTWWNKSGPFMGYLSRCSYMLRQGDFKADACYFYGDQTPNFYPLHHVVPEKPLLDGLVAGYDYDVLNSDIILNRMTVQNGKITIPGGMEYSVMVLPDQVDMPLEILQKLEKLVQEGITIIGKRPSTVPGLNHFDSDNQALTALADRMWGDLNGSNVKVNRYGKGRVIEGMSASEVLMEDGIGKDFLSEGNTELDYIHRGTGKYDIYFVRNKTDQHYNGICSFRIQDKYPEFWDPSTGEQVASGNYSSSNGRTNIDIDLDPYASVFVVFTDSDRSLEVENKLVDGMGKEFLPLDNDWILSFTKGWGAPNSVELKELKSWTDFKDEGIKYYSGTAKYSKTIEINEESLKNNAGLAISLGEVGDVAEVFVNGESAGILWKEPFVLEISSFLKAGENLLEIEVVNQWVNRLSGDMLLNPDERFCKTNQPFITSDDMGYDNWIGDSDETFRPKKSGLMGPVELIYW